MKPLFDYRDYKAYLVDVADARPRGFRKALAVAMGCQTAYVSQVLGGSYHLSLEQAESAGRFIALSRPEARYFIALVERQRAGTEALRQFFADQLDELREKNLSIKERIGVSSVLSERNQAIYYSSWHYAAVHMAVTIPRLRTRGALLRSLRVSRRKLDDVLEFLCTVGLVTREGESYLPGSTELHLPKASPAIYRHHANWRAQAMESMHQDHVEQALHYSSVSSLSATDARTIKALFTQAISDAVRCIKDSPEEELHGIAIDFFRVDT